MSVFIVGLVVSSFSCMRLQKGALSEVSDRRFPFGLTVKETDERRPSFMVTFVGGSVFELVFLAISVSSLYVSRISFAIRVWGFRWVVSRKGLVGG